MTADTMLFISRSPREKVVVSLKLEWWLKKNYSAIVRRKLSIEFALLRGRRALRLSLLPKPQCIKERYPSSFFMIISSIFDLFLQ